MGSINLKHTGSGSAIALSSDGTSLLLDGTAIGGGGADLYAANESNPTAQPSSTGSNAIAIGDSAIATGSESFAFGKSRASGTESIAASIRSNTTSFGAQGTNSIAIGKNAKALGGSYGISIGGWYPTASNTYAVAIGNWSTASANPSIALGTSNNASSSKAIAIGNNCSAQAQRSINIGAESTISSVATASIIIGNNGKSDTAGKFVFSNGYFSATGDCQSGQYILRADTTDASPTDITTDNTSAGLADQVVLPNDSCYGFTGTVIARENSDATNDFAVWEIKGGAVRAASAATIALGSYNINKISESTGATNWSIALSADTTNGAVAITVTGEASHNIRWVATVNTTEVTY
jgi:hypothetical protein